MARKKKIIDKLIGIETSPDVSGFAWNTCKNCTYNFEGNYCPACGQSTKEVQQPIGHFFRDLAGSLFSFDLRLFRSLPVLLFRPGAISSEYIEGKRKRFVAPFRLFFFMSVVFFFLISWQTQKKVEQAFDDPDFSVSADSFEQQLSIIADSDGDNDTTLKITSWSQGASLLNALEKSLREELTDTHLNQDERLKLEGELAAINNPNYLISKAYQYLSWSFFILMPWFALILFMFFFRKRKYYVEHLIFSVNLHTFYFLILILTVVIGIFFPSALSKMGFWIFLLMIIYSVIGIKNFYQKRWFSAVLYSLTVFTLYFISTLALIVVGVIVATQIM